MNQIPPSRPTDARSADEEGGAPLDAARDDLRAGCPVDRAALLARHPELAEAMAALDHLLCEGTTLADGSPVRPPVSFPEQVGPYRVERQLGVGGFGIVYLAFDPDVKRRVALKLLHPDRLDPPEAVRRCTHEARATGVRTAT